MIQVFINHGRYLARCPKCENVHTVEAATRTLVCPVCWPGLLAQKMHIDKFGAQVLMPHFDMIFETRDKAIAAGEEYALEFPPADVMTILRPRNIENMNWLPGETLDDLRGENKEHGLDGAV
jgi:hypothetical protein